MAVKVPSNTVPALKEVEPTALLAASVDVFVNVVKTVSLMIWMVFQYFAPVLGVRAVVSEMNEHPFRVLLTITF
jgi:hypothetical protein